MLLLVIGYVFGFGTAAAISMLLYVCSQSDDLRAYIRRLRKLKKDDDYVPQTDSGVGDFLDARLRGRRARSNA